MRSKHNVPRPEDIIEKKKTVPLRKTQTITQKLHIVHIRLKILQYSQGHEIGAAGFKEQESIS